MGIKMELRGLTIPYAKRKARKGREKETKIQKRMEELDNLISNPANTNHITCQLKAEYITLKEDLCLIYENKAKGAIIRSKTKWIEQGKKPTKYFFNLEKRNYNRKVITVQPKNNARARTSFCVRKKKFFLRLIAGRLSLSPGNRKNFFAVECSNLKNFFAVLCMTL